MNHKKIRNSYNYFLCVTHNIPGYIHICKFYASRLIAPAGKTILNTRKNLSDTKLLSDRFFLQLSFILFLNLS